MMLQAYDFLELARRHDCVLQMGGSDQWGNIVNGVELARRVDGRGAVRPDHAADHHRVRRQDGQDRRGRGLAQRRACCRPTTTGSSGATPRTPTSAASCACSPSCRWPRSRGWKRCEGAEINEAKMVLANEATRLCHGEEARGAGGGDGAANLSAGGRRRGDGSAERRGAARRARRRHVRRSSVPPRRPRRQQRRGRRPDQGRRRARQQRRRDRRDAHGHRSPTSMRDGEIKLSAGKKRHALVRLAADVSGWSSLGSARRCCSAAMRGCMAESAPALYSRAWLASMDAWDL